LVCERNSIQFTNTTDTFFIPTTYTWSFGDGGNSTDRDPLHTYLLASIYNVTLDAVNAIGCTVSVVQPVTVNPLPVVDFLTPSVCLGQPTSFSATPVAGATYAWNFGDGFTGSGQSVSHTYSTADTFLVKLVETLNGCMDSLSKSVIVFPVPTPPVLIPNTICQGETASFQGESSAGNVQVTYEWNFGDGSPVSNVANTTHIYNTPGTFLVTLTKITGQGCTRVDSVNVVVKESPVPNFMISDACSSAVNIITDNSVYDVPAPPSSFYEVDWYNDGSYEPAGPFDPLSSTSFPADSLGNFFAKIRVSNTNGCQDSVVLPFVVNPVPQPFFNPHDLCLGDTIHFVNLTTFPDAPGQIGSLSYLWNFGDGETSTDINPVHRYDDTFRIFTVTLTATSIQGCSAVFDSTLIVYPLPFADFVFGPTCFGRNITFDNLDTIPFGTLTYFWDFGDGTISNDLAPVKVYNTIGSFPVRHVATSDKRCTSEITKVITIYPTPSANFIATNVCEQDSTQFTNLSTVASGTLTFVWDFGDTFNSTEDEPGHVYAADGSYNVQLIAISNFACRDSITKTIQVYDNPTVEFSVAPVCFGQPSEFENTSRVNPPSTIVLNSWSFGDGSNSLDFEPTHLYASASTFLVTLTVTTDKGCVNSDSRAAVVNQGPEVFISHNKPLAFCNGDDVTLFALPFPPPPISSYNYVWSTTSTDSFIIVTTAATYCVTASDQNGCSATACESVTVYSLPVADAFPDTTVSKGFPVMLMATGGVTYQWSADQPDAGLSDPNVQSPTATPQQTTTFTVTVTDASGCTNTATVTVTVNEDYVVNAVAVITPNGDGYNDLWNIDNILTYPDNEVLIFDRWGTKVFEMKNYDNTWDGTYKGKDLPQGPYYYVIKFDNNPLVYKGSVSIIR